MTDKEKQIEEIILVVKEKMTDNASIDIDEDLVSFNGNDFDHIAEQTAEALYNADYRKIPEGAVVLTKEEYEKLKGRAEEVFNEMTERMKAEVKIAKKMGIVKGSKETAREILNELYVQFSADYLVGLRNEYKDWKYADLIKRYAKSVGVEIKE